MEGLFGFSADNTKTVVERIKQINEELANFIDLPLDEYNDLLINKFNGYHVNNSSSVFFYTEEDVNSACENLNLIYKMMDK